jgi:beta-alanine--pyruvate transaminase
MIASRTLAGSVRAASSLGTRGFASQSQSGGLESFWMPFSNNRAFKQQPRIVKESSGMYFTSQDGRQILDGSAGLWCTNAGHCHPRIVEAIQKQAATLDFAPSFQFGHPAAFDFANDLLGLLPNRDFGHVFFTNCGSSAVDTALKISMAYHRARGESSRVRLIGRERGYHGVGFGGISVGGIVANRKAFLGLPYVDHLPHTHSLKDMAFSRGQPDWGAHLADTLESIVTLHDASNIACVIVEPVQGSTGVVVPPKGYLQKLRDICTKHGILLIFDEVITGFGRLGEAFGVQKFDVEPDMICVAKGLTNATVPAGAVICKQHIYDAFMDAANKTNSAIELFHGYTYSGHPLAMAAGKATLQVYREEGLFENANSLSQYWEDAFHSVRCHLCLSVCRVVGLC